MKTLNEHILPVGQLAIDFYSLGKVTPSALHPP